MRIFARMDYGFIEIVKACQFYKRFNEYEVVIFYTNITENWEEWIKDIFIDIEIV